jgi:uncharacterized protein involved in cysteine biosynthesis
MKHADVLLFLSLFVFPLAGWYTRFHNFELTQNREKTRNGLIKNKKKKIMYDVNAVIASFLRKLQLNLARSREFSNSHCKTCCTETLKNKRKVAIG